jgi:hypothetical protein
LRRAAVAISPLLVVALLVLPACREVTPQSHEIKEPVTLKEIPGTEIEQITLTKSAAERLGIKTVSVEEAGVGSVIPSAAVFLDPDGKFWVYTNPEPLVFVRQEISFDHEDGDRTFLSAPLPRGTRIVVVGVAELSGAESEIGH